MNICACLCLSVTVSMSVYVSIRTDINPFINGRYDVSHLISDF